MFFFSEVQNASVFSQDQQRTSPLSIYMPVLDKPQGNQYIDTLNVYCLSQDKMKFPC